MASPKRLLSFTVSPRILEPLGLEQLQDPALAILELVKNAWDADATTIEIQILDNDLIVVNDNGSGMSVNDFERYWLVLGETHKRRSPVTRRGRPVLGEKGLGRLASFALGHQISIASKARGHSGFIATVDWRAILNARRLDAVGVRVAPATRSEGTTLRISALTRHWKKEDTDTLARHVEFLAIPREGDTFSVSLTTASGSQIIETRPDILVNLAEAELRVAVGDQGVPRVTVARVDQERLERVAFRGLPRAKLDPRLSGAEIKLLFLKRAGRARATKALLIQDRARTLLETYEGVRVFRDGLNVPPYGLAGSDWAKLEKQRTSTGGPTLVPGNSQLIGEVLLSRKQHAHLKVTAGRSGFTDQAAVESLAEYVRWAARELGTIRRAAHFRIREGKVPARLDDGESNKETVSRPTPIEELNRTLDEASVTLRSPSEPPRAAFENLIEKGKAAVEQYQMELRTARLYAQLATAGASAASFAHELRKDFDIVEDIVGELRERGRNGPFREQIAILAPAWETIRGFVGLFRLIPIKVRREVQVVRHVDLERSLDRLIGGLPHQGTEVTRSVEVPEVRMAPSELDAIILNLYTNALKAVRESANRMSGKVDVRLRTDAQGALIIEVFDNGRGVAPEVAQSMWEPVEGSFEEGTGMGLPIISFLARLYRGHAEWVDKPTPDFRTLFRVTLAGAGTNATETTD